MIGTLTSGILIEAYGIDTSTLGAFMVGASGILRSVVGIERSTLGAFKSVIES